MALLETLIDDFEDSSLDTDKWQVGSSSNVTLTEQNGRLEFLSTGATGNYALFSKTTNYSFENTYAYFEIDPTGLTSGNGSSLITSVMPTDSSGYFSLLLRYNSADGKKYVDIDFWDDDSEVYESYEFNATNHKYLRIRTSGTTLYFEYSADGSSWNTFESYTTVATLTSVKTRFYFDAKADAISCYVNSFNYSSSPEPSTIGPFPTYLRVSE